MSNDAPHVNANITRVWNETPTLVGLELSVDPDVAAKFTVPGQYLVIHPEGEEKPVFMAIASGPGQKLELLVGSGAAEKLAPAADKSLAIDPPGGKGYPIDLAAGKDLVLFAVGSGMSAIRSVVEHVVANRADFGAVTLYCGAKTEEEHAYRGRAEAWQAANVTIHRTVSKPYVQDLFRANKVDVANAVAFVCGMKGMVQGVTEALVEAGMAAENVRQNF